ncbi:hypothetical protein K0M31_016060 [Melipona bicolor]|uniref:Uncharacterized protein n=1 Tax=Melipona bicolor TaxID=60889 RepID=A0AA40G722_9HYME|nr:hypothetical protein K0M31_016060 [Melipona bicolor]
MEIGRRRLECLGEKEVGERDKGKNRSEEETQAAGGCAPSVEILPISNIKQSSVRNLARMGGGGGGCSRASLAGLVTITGVWGKSTQKSLEGSHQTQRRGQRNFEYKEGTRRFQRTTHDTSAAALPSNRRRASEAHTYTHNASAVFNHRTQRSLDTRTPASDDRHSNSDAGPTSTRSLRDEKVPGPSQRETRRAIIQHHHSFTGRNTMTLTLSVSLTLGRECCSDPTVPRLRDSNT